MGSKSPFIARIFCRILNLSLLWKVGAVIGACVIINTLIAFYFYTEFSTLKAYIQKSPYLSYKALAQEGLWLSQRLKASSEVSERTYLTVQIKSLAQVGLKGGTYERDLWTLLQVQHPLEDPKIRELLEAIYQNPEDPRNSERWESLLGLALKGESKIQKKLKQTSRQSFFLVILFLVLVFFLFWGALAFFWMVKRPLDRITAQIRDLLFRKETYCLEDPETCEWRYYARDEIGQLTEAVRNLLRNYGELALFKHTIEEDQTVEEVYERLAQVFKEKLGITTFAFYQVSNSQNTMQIMHLSPSELEVNSEKLFNADFCRAKRTGHPVNSMIQHGVCPLFLWPEEAEHYCIPFISGGQCIGVAQILLPKTPETRSSKKIREKLQLAERYIREAVPVIEAKRYAERLKDQSLKDPLTGLYNRRFLEEAIDNIVAGILRRKSVLGILMADLDYFKSINDQFGHDVGDRILRETAQLLKKNVRSSDIVVRFGGEEFLILLVDVQKDESLKVAEKLRRLVESHRFEVPTGLIQRTISIGVSEFPTDAQGIWEAIKYADVALYKAKERGRNRVVRFTPDMWPSEQY